MSRFRSRGLHHTGLVSRAWPDAAFWGGAHAADRPDRDAARTDRAWPSRTALPECRAACRPIPPLQLRRARMQRSDRRSYRSSCFSTFDRNEGSDGLESIPCRPSTNIESRTKRQPQPADAGQFQCGATDVEAEDASEEIEFEPFDPSDRQPEIASERSKHAGSGGREADPIAMVRVILADRGWR